jgi:hypothetical protein
MYSFLRGTFDVYHACLLIWIIPIYTIDAVVRTLSQFVLLVAGRVPLYITSDYCNSNTVCETFMTGDATPRLARCHHGPAADAP